MIPNDKSRIQTILLAQSIEIISYSLEVGEDLFRLGEIVEEFDKIPDVNELHGILFLVPELSQF